MNLIFKTLLAGTAFVCAVAPSYANVKTGVDAWERGDFATAVKEWRPLAVKGDADAQFNLAQAYRFGRGVPSDMKQAEDWYRRAATQGHVQAEDNLGLIMFQNGDTAGAMPLIERSANRGEPRAQFVYGTALFNGDMAKQDWPRAYGYMTRASAAGLSRASTALAQMDQYIPLEQRQQGLTIARQLEAQASRSKFAQVQPQKPAPVMVPQRPLPKIATNDSAYPAPYPQAAPQAAPQPYPQSYPSYPQASAPVPMPPVGNDPYVDAPPTGGEEPVVIPTRKSAKAPTTRAQSFPNTRGALPSPRTSGRTPVKSQPNKTVDDQMDMPEPPANSGEWNTQNGANGAGYPNQSYPAYPQDPAAGYPSQPYPQPYPAQSYPGQSYPAQGDTGAGYPAQSYPQPRPAVRTSPVRKVAPVVARPAVARPVQTAASGGGNWRIQLGAFSAPNGADLLWKSLRGRVGALSGKQPYLVKAGTVTRLQAGGFASRGAAESACGQVRAAGNNCLVVSR